MKMNGNTTATTPTAKAGISITTMKNWWTEFGKGRGTFNVSLYLRIQEIKEQTNEKENS